MELTIRAPIVGYGDWIALNPKKCGYFDDREVSGLFLHQFDLENGSNKAEIPYGVDVTRIQHAVAINRLVILNEKDSPIPSQAMQRLSNRTRIMLKEQGKEINPRSLLYNTTEKNLISKVLPQIEDNSILEQLLQLEVNGDNANAQPRSRVVDYLTGRIKKYAKQVSIVDTATNKIVKDEVVEEEGEKDIEFTDLPETGNTRIRSSKRKKG